MVNDGIPGRSRRDRSLAWVLGLGVVPVAVLALIALTLRPVPDRAPVLPLLVSSWGADRSCISTVQTRSYTLAVGPDDRDSFPYALHINHFPADALESEARSIRANQEATTPPPRLELSARDFASVRNTTVEIDTFAQPREERGGALTFQAARWVEDGRALATLSTREVRPTSEIVAVIEGFSQVARPEFETKLCADVHPEQRSVPRLVGPDTIIQLASTDWLRENVGPIGSLSVRNPDESQGTAEAMVAAAVAASPHAEPVTIRGRPGWKVFGDNNTCGSLVWAETDAFIAAESCFAPGDVEDLNQLRVANSREWRDLVFDNLEE